MKDKTKTAVQEVIQKEINELKSDINYCKKLLDLSTLSEPTVINIKKGLETSTEMLCLLENVQKKIEYIFEVTK